MASERKLFAGDGSDFSACNAAEQWCQENGFSVGTMQRGSPRGLMKGDYLISKWRNLRKFEVDALHGQMFGDMRHGPVTVVIFDAADCLQKLHEIQGEAAT